MDWHKIENIINEPLPECVKKILSFCGYDSMMSLKRINCESVEQIQRQINSHFLHGIRELTCCHSDFYAQQIEFEFLPGHLDLILALPHYLKSETQSTDPVPNIEYSTVLNSMVRTAVENSDRGRNQYDDIIRLFSTYTYLMCGRSCYEFLNHNLPLPSTSTVCK